MSAFPQCNRRGKIISGETCHCLSNRIIHQEPFLANIQTCQTCRHRNMEDDPDLPPVGGKPKGPSIIGLAGHFARAIASHVKDGAMKVSQEEFEKRLEKCSSCQFLENMRCKHMKCGCYITTKARWRSEHCPIGKWHTQFGEHEKGRTELL